MTAQQPPAAPPQPPMYPPQQQSPAGPPPQRPMNPPQAPGGHQPPQRPQYQEPILDMGSSLGYGQGMEYQYFNAPQPSQSIPMLRQARLQQLREDRMRRQQRRMQQDITSLIKRKGGQPPSGALMQPPVAPPQMPPVLPLPPTEASPIRSSTLPPPALQRGLTGRSISPAAQPAAAVAEDTGMLQRVRIGRATMILTGAFIASRVLGLLRTSMFAFVFGTSTTSDAYLQAFLVPDLIFNIVAGGALSSAFIPGFTRYVVGERDQKTAWHVTSSALNLAIAVMMGLALVAIIFARQLVPLYNPGEPASQLDLIASLTRIMLLQSIALGGGVIVTSILQARQNFRSPAIGTILYNVGLIAGLIPGIILAYHGQRNDTVAVYAATWGVVISKLACTIPSPLIGNTPACCRSLARWYRVSSMQASSMSPFSSTAASSFCW